MSAVVAYFGGVAYSVEQPPATAGAVVTVATPSPAPGPPVLVTVGDSYTDGRLEPGGWAPILADRLGVELANLAIGGSGYAWADARAVGSMFPTQVATGLPVDAAVVVVFGGINDVSSAEPGPSVTEAARATFATVRRLAPRAALVVVGPQWYNATPPALASQHRDRVRAAALEFGATWIDPLTEAWFADPALIGPDGVHPNAAGQRVIADRLEPVIADALVAT